MSFRHSACGTRGRTKPSAILALLFLWLTQIVLPMRGAAAEPAQRVLFDFKAPGLGLSQMSVTGSTVALSSTAEGPTLQVNSGHDQKWPGVTLKAGSTLWDLSRFEAVTVAVRNTGTNRATIHGRLDNPGADGLQHCVTASIALAPSQAGVLHLSLKRASDDRLGGKLFGMRGYPVSLGGPNTVDPTKLNQILVFISQPTADHVFSMGEIRATGDYVPPTAWTSDAEPFFPCIDTFGQYKHKDWPGKTHSVAELGAQRTQEARELDALSSPVGWDKYGGWAAGPQLSATGFFRTEKHDGKWWLVDPDGRLFFSHGIDCVRMGDVTPIEKREHWFEDFPGDRPEFGRFVVAKAFALKGAYAGTQPRSVCFGEANLFRKYGSEWSELSRDTIHRRLRSWGLNSIGMWSDASTFLMRRTAYVDSIGTHGVRMIAGSEGYWGKFPDVWDTGFDTHLRQAMAAKVGKSANDPWCIGYFADNEMSWGDEISLALAALASPADQAAKQAFLAQLKVKYSDIQRLNKAWGTEHDSWAALGQSTTLPDLKLARADLTAFYSKTAEQYFRSVRAAIKAQAPQQLYLGCRFAWVNPLAAAAAAQFCDVVSYNLYQRGVSDFQFNGGKDVPLIIGEFHFGALDRGMFHTGLVPVASQAARANAYREYVEGALRHPSFVGCHWFQYQDEPTTGRVYDEENYQIGFVDVADTPYRETIDASRQVAVRIYQIRSGH